MFKREKAGIVLYVKDSALCIYVDGSTQTCYAESSSISCGFVCRIYSYLQVGTYFYKGGDGCGAVTVC